MLRSLVVDDELNIRNLLRTLLESAGHLVVLAANGREALNLIENPGPFDLMVVDISLGDMSGLDVIRVCKQVRPSLPIVAVSGYIGLESVELRRALRAEGVHHTLPKPFKAQDLLTAAREALMEELPPA